MVPTRNMSRKDTEVKVLFWEWSDACIVLWCSCACLHVVVFCFCRRQGILGLMSIVRSDACRCRNRGHPHQCQSFGHSVVRSETDLDAHQAEAVPLPPQASGHEQQRSCSRITAECSFQRGEAVKQGGRCGRRRERMHANLKAQGPVLRKTAAGCSGDTAGAVALPVTGSSDSAFRVELYS